MKNLSMLGLALICFGILIGCELTSQAPPPATAAMVKPGKKQADLATLQEGRLLFVHRCIECHTLPPFWNYTNEDWPRILDSMAHRARLSLSEREAILAYIRAVRSNRS